MSQDSLSAMAGAPDLRERLRRSFDGLSVVQWRITGAALLSVVAIGVWGFQAFSGEGIGSSAGVAELPRATQASSNSPSPNSPSRSGLSTSPANGSASVGTGPSAAPLVVTSDVVVQVSGAVGNAGVYHLASSARVQDALVAAGGSTPDADVDRLDLAAKLQDGQHIFVLRHGEALPAGVNNTQSGSPPAVVDINAASAQELDGLPGVGPSTAQAIVEFRSEHGAFRSVADLGRVRGIGPAKLAQLQSHVRV